MQATNRRLTLACCTTQLHLSCLLQRLVAHLHAHTATHRFDTLNSVRKLALREHGMRPELIHVHEPTEIRSLGVSGPSDGGAETV